MAVFDLQQHSQLNHVLQLLLIFPLVTAVSILFDDVRTKIYGLKCLWEIKEEGITGSEKQQN